jgi:hypothetical protein
VRDPASEAMPRRAVGDEAAACLCRRFITCY